MRLALLILFLCSSRLHAQAIVYSESNFNAEDWTFLSFATAGGAAAATQISSGGNSGAYLEISLSMQAGAGGAVVWGFQNAAVYDPGSQGAIASVGYMEDVKKGGANQAAGAALLQNGFRYWRFTWETDPATWITRIATPDVEFSGYFLDGTQDNGSNPTHPDFSGTGSPITFGFYRNIQGVAESTFTTLSGLDNWQTTVTSVPEPSSYGAGAALLVFGVVVLRRHRPLAPRPEPITPTSSHP
jgi:hypothetical protein